MDKQCDIFLIVKVFIVRPERATKLISFIPDRLSHETLIEHMGSRDRHRHSDILHQGVDSIHQSGAARTHTPEALVMWLLINHLPDLRVPEVIQ